MLHHLSPQLFKERIADFDKAGKWSFKCDVPTLILFRTQQHLYLKGLRDTYETIEQDFPGVKTYEVVEDENPEIAAAYDIKTFPTVMYLKPGSDSKIVEGYLSPEEVREEIKRYLIE